MCNVLEIQNLNKEYPTFKLENATFSIKSGAIMGFIGRNGAGKTTTLKCLLNLAHPTSGDIKFFGLSWAENEREIKQRIGYASGGVNYYPTKTLNKIAETTKTFYDNWDESAYSDYMQKFELDGTKKVKELSEGMKVKFNLVLALSHRAELLLLDEPTSGLDPVSRDELLTIFENLSASGIAILFSTHITSDLDKCADYITYIKRGKIVASCTKSEFCEKFGESNLENIMLKIEKEASL